MSRRGDHERVGYTTYAAATAAATVPLTVTALPMR